MQNCRRNAILPFYVESASSVHCVLLSCGEPTNVTGLASQLANSGSSRPHDLRASSGHTIRDLRFLLQVM